MSGPTMLLCKHTGEMAFKRNHDAPICPIHKNADCLAVFVNIADATSAIERIEPVVLCGGRALPLDEALAALRGLGGGA